MSKNIPVLLEFNPEKVVGYIQIHDEEFLELLIKSSPPWFNLGVAIDPKKEKIAAISFSEIIHTPYNGRRCYYKCCVNPLAMEEVRKV